MSKITGFFKQYGWCSLLLPLLLINIANGYITALTLFCIGVFVFIGLKGVPNKSVTTIILFSFTYAFFMVLSPVPFSLSDACINMLPFLPLYIVGSQIVNRSQSPNEIATYLLLVIICYSFVYYWATLNDVLTTGQLVNPFRMYEFQEGAESHYTATHVGTNVAIGFSGLMGFFMTKKKGILNYSFLFVMLLSLLSTIHLVNRSGVYVFAVVGLIVLLYVFSNKKSVVGVVFLALAALAVIRNLDILGGGEVAQIYADRNADYEASAATVGARLPRWISGITDMMSHPFGWWSISNQDYWMHNMWLDIAKRAGIVPLLFLLILTVRSIKNIIKLVKRKKSALNYLLLAMNACFFLSCMIEPIIGGTHLMLYCLVWGVQDRLLQMEPMSTVN
jgi:O-antigen ligase